MPAATTIRESTQEFVLTGSDVIKAIHNRATRHQNEIGQCLDKVSALLRKKADGDYDELANHAVGAMMAIVRQEHLTSDSLEIKAQLDRAAYLTNERLDLSCIARNLVQEQFYKVTLEEAKRYGLV